MGDRRPFEVFDVRPDRRGSRVRHRTGRPPGNDRIGTPSLDSDDDIDPARAVTNAASRIVVDRPAGTTMGRSNRSSSKTGSSTSGARPLRPEPSPSRPMTAEKGVAPEDMIVEIGSDSLASVASATSSTPG